MNTSIRTRLFLTILLATGTVVGGMYFFMQWSFDRGFLEYVNVRQERQLDALSVQLEQIYQQNGGWKGLKGQRLRWTRLLLELFGEGSLNRPMMIQLMRGKASTWPPDDLADSPLKLLPAFIFRLMLLDADKSVIFGHEAEVEQLRLRPLKSANQVVGYLGLLPKATGPTVADEHNLKFAEQQGESFLLIAVLMILVSMGMALPLSHRFVRPVRALQSASQKMAAGDYSVRTEVRGRDELGRLARDFNNLAKALENNEQLRRQWVADISHELRTPLAILHGEIEALQDGVRKPTSEALASLHTEVRHLSRLVDDLYELSMSDIGALSYRKRDTDPLSLLLDCIENVEHELDAGGISLRKQGLVEGKVTVHGDPDRFAQLFNNLLRNSLRYTDPGGVLDVGASLTQEQVIIDIQDSAPGVPEPELPKLFDRLYRVEASRSRAHGGAGLGLSICQNIVAAHDGLITAHTSELGGLRVHIELPRISN